MEARPRKRTRPSRASLGLLLLLRTGAGSAGPVEAAVGWSDSHPQREVMESDVQLTVLPSQLAQLLIASVIISMSLTPLLGELAEVATSTMYLGY